MANLTPEQFEKALANAKQALQANMGKILVNATGIGSTEMQRRVFNRGITTAGKQMNYRSKSYIKKRVDADLQVNWKDLAFTNNLFYSMTILTTAEKEVTYGFNNGETAQIAEWQQTSPKQVNEPIFELSDKEIAKMERQMAIDALSLIQGAIDNFPNVPNIRGETARKHRPPKQAKKKMTKAKKTTAKKKPAIKTKRKKK